MENITIKNRSTWVGFQQKINLLVEFVDLCKIEGAPSEDTLHLANLEEDMAQYHNVCTAYPELTAELKSAAEISRGSNRKELGSRLLT